MGPRPSRNPARARRTALATASTASSWPTSRRCRASSSRVSRWRSSVVSSATGTPVRRDTIWATCSTRTSAAPVPRLRRQRSSASLSSFVLASYWAFSSSARSVCLRVVA